MQPHDIEIVRDLTAASACATGYLRLSRLIVRNRYGDGSHSAEYPCDVVTRPMPDAVAIVLYRIDDGRVRVALREGPRAPVYLRRHKANATPDSQNGLTLRETPAGLLEKEDIAEIAVEQRAAAEAWEETGLRAPRERIRRLGGELFASPGTSDEKVFFCEARLDSLESAGGRGDGSTMEEGARLVLMDLDDAIAGCRDGRIPDMKTETALLRLCERIGYLPQFGCFASELPAPWAGRYRRLGIQE